MPTYLDRRQAADFLNDHGFPCTPKTLANLAWSGGGPLFVRYRGHKPLYRPHDLLRWAEEQCLVTTSTADPGQALLRQAPEGSSDPSVGDSATDARERSSPAPCVLCGGGRPADPPRRAGDDA